MPGSFLQSTEWEKFQEILGRKVWRAGENLVMRHDLPGGFNYLYCPRPKTVTSNWLLVVENIAKKENSIFLKIDPAEELQVTSYKLQAASSLQPRKTVILDLQKSEEELLQAMHEKRRYNIRLSERKGVVIGGGRAEDFWDLLKKTAGRESFFTHSRDHYEKLLEVKTENFSNELFFAEYRGETVATAMINFFGPGKTATYLHGASSREHKEVMAPHLLHWCVVMEAKKRGLAFYDFWGVDEKIWPGVTRFKMGFGGKVVEYPPSVDIVYRRAWYRIYKFSKSLKRAR